MNGILGDCKTFNILSIFIIFIQLHYRKTKKIIKLIKFIYIYVNMMDNNNSHLISF